MRRENNPLLETDLDWLVNELGDTPSVDTALEALSRFFDQTRQGVADFQNDAGVRPDADEMSSVLYLVEALRLAFMAMSATRVATESRGIAPKARPQRGYHEVPSWMRFLQRDRTDDSSAGVAAAARVLTPELQVRSEMLVETLAAALQAAGRALLDRPPPPPRQIRWHDDPDLLGLLQDLLASDLSGDGASALSRIATLRRELRAQHQIEVQDYTGGNDWCFNVEPDLSGSGEVRTLAPALVLGDVALKRGLARVPPPIPPSDGAAAPRRSGEKERES